MKNSGHVSMTVSQQQIYVDINDIEPHLWEKAGRDEQSSERKISDHD